jgi:hypothetical protein
MAGFCRNCGSPLADAQGFCTKCGTPVAGPPARPAAQPPAAAVPPPAPVPRTPAPPQYAQPAAPVPAAAPSKGGNTLLKVLLGFVIVIFVLGAAAVGGVWYLAHRAKEKLHEMGIDEIANQSQNGNRGPALRGVDACSLLSKADVAQAVNMDVVRAEPLEGGEEGCSYSVMGDYVDMIAKHASLLKKQETDDQQRKMIENFAKEIGHSQNNESAPRHPGESPVFMFSVDNNAAMAQMSMMRATFGRIGVVTALPGIGDDAYDLANAMMMARKGDKVVHVMYMMCPCTTEDATPMLRKIVAGM